MIGIRPILSGALAAALCAGIVQAGGEGPGSRLASERLVLERAASAEAALASLEASLERAVDDARRGAARIVTGDEPPSEPFEAAADTVLAAEPDAAAAASALRALDGARRARDATTSALAIPVASGDLASIAGQLRSTGAAGDAFAATRRRAEGVTSALDAALAALADGDVGAADEAVDRAREHHDAVVASELVLATLPVWIETTDAMIAAMESIVDATRAGDAAAARAAAAEFAALGEDAETADRALRIAVSEGGASIASVAVGRLADALADVRVARAQVRTDTEGPSA